jgi:hypothetical protein
MKEEHFKTGEPPNDPLYEEYGELIFDFFDRIGDVVIIENHIHKFKDIHQLLNIIHDSAKMCNVKICIIYSDGLWYLAGAETPQDILDLPMVAKMFSKLYRHHAHDYRKKETLIEYKFSEEKI